jgi:hypothetical protein
MREICRYDTEAECEALEQEKHAMELKLVTKERKYASIILRCPFFNAVSRINESTEKNAFLKVTMNLKAMGLSDESEWKVESCTRVAWNVQSSSAHLPLLSYFYFTGKTERRGELETSTGRGALAVAIKNEELQYRTLTLSAFTARSSFKSVSVLNAWSVEGARGLGPC